MEKDTFYLSLRIGKSDVWCKKKPEDFVFQVKWVYHALNELTQDRAKPVLEEVFKFDNADMKVIEINKFNDGFKFRMNKACSEDEWRKSLDNAEKVFWCRWWLAKNHYTWGALNVIPLYNQQCKDAMQALRTIIVQSYQRYNHCAEISEKQVNSLTFRKFFLHYILLSALKIILGKVITKGLEDVTRFMIQELDKEGVDPNSLAQEAAKKLKELSPEDKKNIADSLVDKGADSAKEHDYKGTGLFTTLIKELLDIKIEVDKADPLKVMYRLETAIGKLESRLLENNRSIMGFYAAEILKLSLSDEFKSVKVHALADINTKSEILENVKSSVDNYSQLKRLPYVSQRELKQNIKAAMVTNSNAQASLQRWSKSLEHMIVSLMGMSQLAGYLKKEEVDKKDISQSLNLIIDGAEGVKIAYKKILSSNVDKSTNKAVQGVNVNSAAEEMFKVIEANNTFAKSILDEEKPKSILDEKKPKSIDELLTEWKYTIASVGYILVKGDEVTGRGKIWEKLKQNKQKLTETEDDYLLAITALLNKLVFDGSGDALGLHRTMQFV
ncbi:hypothetical protein N480_10195 [Pseudoalteromonas luteoviolacea S2607]|uniref:hypothetical protein n=1 Tax=Pseudoalteromonas luteoviolacea TaxID=43657 RepID=UPI0007B0AF86|nr:hypothetical protein [Pseudoalteromonas luteoviolacea]KZN28455.1 hypothetical protein N480_10195 [Pseudoalteromonas luteoviolacea S2607]